MTPRQAEAVALYRQDLSTPAICETLGITRQRLHQLLDAAGVTKRSRAADRHDDFFDEIADELRRCADAGYSLSNFVDELGFGERTVAYQLKRLGIDPKRLRRYSDKERARWERLYRRHSTSEVAAMTGSPQSTVLAHLRRVGLLRNHSEATSVAVKKYWRGVRAGKVRSRPTQYGAAEHEEWERLYRKHKSTNLVAKLVGVSQGTIYYYLARRGLLVSRSEAVSLARRRRAEREREEKACTP